MKTFIAVLLLLTPLAAQNRTIHLSLYVPKEFVLTVEERVVAVLRDSGFSRTMQRIILAQAKHESGNFTNPLTVNHNNIFAMHHPGKSRPTTSLGPWGRAEGRTCFASFASIESSVTDYILYKKSYGIVDKENERGYVYELKRHRYFEASTELYIRCVQRWMAADSTVRNFSN